MISLMTMHFIEIPSHYQSNLFYNKKSVTLKYVVEKIVVTARYSGTQLLSYFCAFNIF